MIGWMCKHSNVFSRPVLIARGLDLELHLPLCSFQVRVCVPARKFVRPCDGAKFSAVIAEGSHLFPFRTEKLSPPAPMVLQGRPCGRVGRRRISVTEARDSRESRAFVVSGMRGLGCWTGIDRRDPWRTAPSRLRGSLAAGPCGSATSQAHLAMKSYRSIVWCFGRCSGGARWMG